MTYASSAAPMSTETMSDGYEVGYGKPPKASQFKPGQSGNPNGRVKGARNLKTEVREVMKTQITLTQNGQKTRITTRKAVVLRLTEKALSGNIPATRVLLDLIQNYDDHAVDSLSESLSVEDASILEMFAEKIRTGDRVRVGPVEEASDD
jgi:Family of unknown function (DUF5681)